MLELCEAEHHADCVADHVTRLTNVFQHIKAELVPNMNFNNVRMMKNGDAIDRLIKAAQTVSELQNNKGDALMHHLCHRGYLHMVKRLTESEILMATHLWTKHVRPDTCTCYNS
uniref:Uncharacterized protein n=1 Tax=Craspedostauros australis TaxID=1486917 RepID=A0A7R9WRQ0_9STRA|mmetsp:Transcript_17641/g.48972  ORF Transcript_17641/g.48972 Transcript_17641/m.48972 type:complete len:114 (+) Transcript_17641:521-862(+)